MKLGEGSDADAEVANVTDEFHQLEGIAKLAGLCIGILRGVAAQSKNVMYALVAVLLCRPTASARVWPTQVR